MQEDIEPALEPMPSGHVEPQLAKDPLQEGTARSSASKQGLDLTKEARPVHAQIAKRKTKRKKSKIVAASLWLAIILAFGGGGWWLVNSYLNSRIDLNATLGDGTSGDFADPDQQYQRPAIPATGMISDLSEAELLWCLRARLRIETLTAQFSTRREVASLNSMRNQHAVLCDYSVATTEQLAATQELIARRTDNLVQQTINEQLLIIADIEQSWLSDQLVMVIQQLLNRANFQAGNPDGIYGAKTRAAIEQFQRENNIPVNGEASAMFLQRLRTHIRALESSTN